MKSPLLWIWIALLTLVGNLISPSLQTTVILTSFTAEAGTSSITLKWETASETSNLGFYLWRGPTATGVYAKISDFIPSSDEGAGALYEYVDSNVTPGVTYYYKLQDVPDSGALGVFSDPISATIPLTTTYVYLPAVYRGWPPPLPEEDRLLLPPG